MNESSLFFDAGKNSGKCEELPGQRKAFWAVKKPFGAGSAKENKKEDGTGNMPKKEDYEQKTEALMLPIVEEYGFELVDVEYVKEGGTWYLRAYIDKPGGITVDDCETVSRRFSDILDAEDYIADSYVFEVSSPGLGRPLKKEKDFRRSLGEEVEIRTYRAIDRQKEFTGILCAYDKETVTIEKEDGSRQVFERGQIALIRLALDF